MGGIWGAGGGAICGRGRDGGGGDVWERGGIDGWSDGVHLGTAGEDGGAEEDAVVGRGDGGGEGGADGGGKGAGDGAEDDLIEFREGGGGAGAAEGGQAGGPGAGIVHFLDGTEAAGGGEGFAGVGALGGKLSVESGLPRWGLGIRVVSGKLGGFFGLGCAGVEAGDAGPFAFGEADPEIEAEGGGDFFAPTGAERGAGEAADGFLDEGAEGAGVVAVNSLGGEPGGVLGLDGFDDAFVVEEVGFRVERGEAALVGEEVGEGGLRDGEGRPDLADEGGGAEAFCLQGEEEGGGGGDLGGGVDGCEGGRGPRTEVFFFAPAVAFVQEFRAIPPDTDGGADLSDRGAEDGAGAEIFLKEFKNFA